MAVSYKPRPDITPETELSTLSAVYRFILDSYAKKKAGVNGTGGDTKGPDNVSRRTEYTR